MMINAQPHGRKYLASSKNGGADLELEWRSCVVMRDWRAAYAQPQDFSRWGLAQQLALAPMARETLLAIAQGCA